MTYYMGVDPGPSTGIALLCIEDLESDWTVFQVNEAGATWLVGELCRAYCPRAVAYEEFVPGNRAGTKGRNAQVTRRISYQVPMIAKGCYVVARRAADVKPWATDKRLAKTEFPWGTKFRDARDAGRHALYAAVHDGKERDPLA